SLDSGDWHHVHPHPPAQSFGGGRPPNLMPVLIVDDEKDIRETLEEFLVDEGFEVRTAADGGEALGLLTDSELPCVVILDLMMPVLSGNDVIDRMQQSQRLAPVRVIITTSDPSRAPSGV